MSRITSVFAVVALASAAAMLASPAVAATPTIPDEPFSGVATPSGNWITSGLNWTPCLTAATLSAPASLPACPAGPYDAVGDGALRLTEDVVQGSIAILNTPIDTSRGLQIKFDFFQYNTSSAGDGMAFFLIDGAASPTTAGSYGGGMGYASYHPASVPGLVGGYVGIAFDTYGAFSDPGIGSGGPGVFTPNSIAVRGNETSDYYLISSHAAAGPVAVPTATDRDDAVRHVVVTISRFNVMSIDIDYGAGLVTEVSGLDLETVNGAGSLPSTLKLGFSGSTGGAYAVQEIRNFEIQTLAPDLAVTMSAGSLDAAQNADVAITVRNAATTGATDDLITVTSTLPAGVTPLTAVGTGWTCDIVGQLVTCTRAGTGADRLAAGESAPPITLTVHTTALPVTITASAAVLDDSSAANDTGSVRLAALAATGVELWPIGLALGLLACGTVLVRRRHVRA